MQNSHKNYLARFHEKISDIAYQIFVFYVFIKVWIKGTISVLRNIKRDVNRYNLHYLPTLYNALIKYPVLGFRPSEFFMYKLYKNSYKVYISFFDCLSNEVRINKHMPYLLVDKLQFKLYVKDKLEGPKLIAYFNHRNKKITHYAKPTTDKVVIKPSQGFSGGGIKIVSSDNFVEALKKCSTSYIAEEYVEQHSFINKIFPDSVNTIRMLSIKKNGDPIPIKAALRVGRTSTNQVDNITLGGITIDVDMESGMLKKGHTFYQFDFSEYLTHPDTNYKFYGQTIPYFREVKELVAAAHKLFPMFALIAWDVAITETGPVIIEGNRTPDVSSIQIHQPLKESLSPVIYKK